MAASVDRMTSDSGHAGWLRQARSHLSDADPVLARLIDDRPDFDPRAWIAQLPPATSYLFSAALEPTPAPINHAMKGEPR